MASRGVNKVIIVGNLGAKPELRYMPNGNAVCNVTVATSETWRDKNTGEQREQTEWHRVTLYRRLAEIAAEYLNKGSKVYLEGRLQTRKWQDQAGTDRYTTEIIANELQMLDSRNSQQSQQQGNWNNNQYNQPQAAAPVQQNQGYGQQNQNYSQAPAQQAAAPAVNMEPETTFDDDIPF